MEGEDGDREYGYDKEYRQKREILIPWCGSMMTKITRTTTKDLLHRRLS